MSLRPLLIIALLPLNGFSSTWLIENSKISVRFEMTDNGRFYPAEIVDKSSGISWHNTLDNPSTPLTLRIGDRILDGQTAYKLRLYNDYQLKRGGKNHVFILDEKSGHGQLALHVEIYDNQPFLRTYWTYQNKSDTEHILREANILNWEFAPEDNYRALYVNQWRWSNDRVESNFEVHNQDISWQGWPVNLYTGEYAQHCAWVAIKKGIEEKPSNGLVVGWEYNGRAKGLVFHDKSQSRLSLSVVPVGLYYPLKLGQVFQSPASFIGFFNGDWDEAGYRTQRFVEQAIARPMPDPDRFPYVMFDGWGYGEDINEERLKKAARIASLLGVEVFTIDLGWARRIGDWQEDKKKFPSGMRAFSDYVHSLGMKFGLHWAFVQARRDSKVLKDNPGWSSSENHGYFGADSLCLGHEPVKRWLVEEGTRLIKKNKVDWILQDGENMVKYCTRQSHTHHPYNSNFASSTEGLDEIIAAIQDATPGTLWENCECGGKMMTYKMTRLYDTSISSDNINTLETLKAIWGVTFPFPPRYADRYMQEHPTKYSLRVHMFGGPLILMQAVTDWDETTQQLVAGEIKIYKKLRGLIRDSKIIHLLNQPQPTYKGNANGQKIAISYKNDAIQAYHEGEDKSVIFVYRHQGPNTTQLIKPRGLRSNGRYLVIFQEDERILPLSGRQLMEEGVEIKLPTQEFAEIVYIYPTPSANRR